VGSRADEDDTAEKRRKEHKRGWGQQMRRMILERRGEQNIKWCCRGEKNIRAQHLGICEVRPGSCMCPYAQSRATKVTISKLWLPHK